MNTSLLYILTGIGVGSIVFMIITRNNKFSRKFCSDIITNFFLIIILTWKLLPVLLAPGDIISNPISIIYTSGGMVGITMGAFLGTGYLVYKIIFFWKNTVGDSDGFEGRYTRGDLGKNGNRHACSLRVRDILKPVIVFFVVGIIVSSSLFFIAAIVRDDYFGDSGITTGNEDVRKRPPVVGGIAPGFELMSTDGDLIYLDDYKGKWVILNFWATWCPPCRAELPTLNRFYDGMNKDRVVILGINASGTERPAGGEDVGSYVSTFAMENGINFTILLDTKGIVSTVYEAGNLPTTVVISPEGIITKIKTGVVDSFWLRSVTNQ